MLPNKRRNRTVAFSEECEVREVEIVAGERGYVVPAQRDLKKDMMSCVALLNAGVSNLLELSYGLGYPVVIINWVLYLGPPGPFSFPDSRDLLEVLGDFLGRERGGGP